MNIWKCKNRKRPLMTWWIEEDDIIRCSHKVEEQGQQLEKNKK